MFCWGDEAETEDVQDKICSNFIKIHSYNIQ